MFSTCYLQPLRQKLLQVLNEKKNVVDIRFGLTCRNKIYLLSSFYVTLFGLSLLNKLVMVSSIHVERDALF